MQMSIQNQRMVNDRTKQQLRQQLMDFDNISGNAASQSEHDRASSSTIYIYKMFLAQEKNLYQNLNMMKQ
jgi:hypothetical protein